MNGWQQFATWVWGIFVAGMVVSEWINKHYRYAEKRLETDDE